MKILGFDSWTVGSHHFQRLIPAFAQRGMNLSLVHLGSWGSDTGRAPRETLGALPARDISSYGNSLERALDEEEPDIVVFLSTNTFAHRAFVRYCRARHIPTLNLYHGLTTTWFDVEAGSGIRSNWLGHLRFVAVRLGKTLRYTLPCYVASLRRTRASREDWRRFMSDLVSMFLARHIAVYADDSRTDACAVYTDPEVEHAMFTYGFRRDQITVVGNPDLVRFRLPDELVGAYLGKPISTCKVMYIDTGLAPAGLIFSSVAQFVDLLKQTAATLRLRGWSMMLKLHPVHNVAELQSALAGSGIQFVDNDEFMDRLRECDASIVETTTLALVPALIGMPLLFAKYGPLSELSYGRGLTSYPNSTMLTDVASFEERLRELAQSLDREQCQRWIHSNTGPLPAAQMPDRVAECVLALTPQRKVAV